jgi:hypothetical protein
MNMKKRREWTKEEKLMIKEGIIVVIGAWIIIIADFYLLENFFSTTLNLKPGSMSLLAGVRTLLIVFYFIGFFPAAILGEFADSYVKKRCFRVLNVLILLLFFGIAVSVAVTLATLFDMLFSDASLLQVPLAAVSVSIPSLIVAAVFKMKRFNNFVKKAFA